MNIPNHFNRIALSVKDKHNGKQFVKVKCHLVAWKKQRKIIFKKNPSIC